MSEQAETVRSLVFAALEDGYAGAFHLSNMIPNVLEVMEPLKTALAMVAIESSLQYGVPSDQILRELRLPEPYVVWILT